MLGRIDKRVGFIAVVALLVSLSFVSSASAVAHRRELHCRTGYKVVAKVVRRDGTAKVVPSCAKKKVAPSTPAPSTTPSVTVPAPTPAPTTAPAPAVDAPTVTTPVQVPSTPSVPTVTADPPAPVVEPPEEEEPEPTPPTTEESSIPAEGVTVQADLRPGFVQNPAAPYEVTWRYSASATRAATAEGAEGTEPAPLPTGRLVFYVDGHLECETHVGGHITSDTCTAELPSLGSHEVEVIYSAGTLWSTVERTDTIKKVPTSISLEAVSEPVPPRKRTIVKNGYSSIRTEVGQLRVTDVGSPVGYPEFDCEGQPKGCVIPVEGTERRDGSVYFTLWGSHEVNTTTWTTQYWSGLSVYEPVRERQEIIWDPPKAEQPDPTFFHVVSEPNSRYYLPSSKTVPVDLSDVHFPFYRLIEGHPGGTVEALEAPMTKVLTFGTYDKLGGSNTSLIGELDLGRPWEESWSGEACEYEVRIDGIESWRVRSGWHVSYYSAWPSWRGLGAGPHTATLWVGRETGSGPGECTLSYGSLELYENYD